MRLLGRPVASARDETAPSRDDATVSSTVPRGFDDAADDAAPPTTRKKQTKTQRLVASMMHSNVATEADALAERLRTGAATTTTTPYSYAGPHPSEWKRKQGEAPSESVPRVARRGIVLRPSVEDRDRVMRLKAERGHRSGLSASAVRRALTELNAATATADAICQELRESGWEMREVVFMPHDDLGFKQLAGTVGAIVVAIPPALQSESLLALLRTVRAGGTIVFQSARVGHFLAHSNHIDICDTHSIPDKRMLPMKVGLEDRCETRNDGYREITLHVLSMPGTSEERNALRNKVLPRLKHRCRGRRVRITYVDLKDDCPNAGPGQALASLLHAVKTGGIFVVLLSAKHEIDWYSSVRICEYVNYMRSEASKEEENALSWLRHAPNDYSRIEIQIAQLLRVYEDLKILSREEIAETAACLSGIEARRLEDDHAYKESRRAQLVLAYYPSKSLYEKLVALKEPEFTNYLMSTDPVHKERIGALFSTLYAHPDVSMSQYLARLDPPLQLTDEKNFFHIRLPPRTTHLADFEYTVLQDVWARIEAEFAPDVAKDMTLLQTCTDPELSLGEKLPFYFHHHAVEKGLIKSLKIGQPTVNVVQGMPGMGTTSLLQHMACVARLMFGVTEAGAAIRSVTVISDYGAAEGRKSPTPTQVLRNIVQQMKVKLRFDDHIPASLEQIRALMLRMFNRVTRMRGRVLIFIDALHLIDNDSGSAWLPNEFEVPIGVQLFLGIHRIDRKREFEKESAKSDERRMPTLEYNLINSYRYRMTKIQHVALGASCPKALKNAYVIDTLKFEERRAYTQRYLRPLGIQLTNTMTMQIMDKTCTGNLRGMQLTCARIAMEDPYDDMFAAVLSKLPDDERGYYHQLLDGVEKFVPKALLALVLPAIACGCNCLRQEDIARIIQANYRTNAAIHDIMRDTVPRLLWSVRFMIKGDAGGGFASVATGTIQVEDQVAHDVIMERYAPKESEKRSVYQMLATYYGDNVTGADLLAKLTILKDMEQSGKSPFAVDGDGMIVNHVLYLDHHTTMNTLKYLPYYYTQARMFDRLGAVLTDLEFLQAKLEIGEGQGLVDDFDRILPFGCGPERPLWISHQLSTSEEVVDVPGAPSGLDGRLRQLAVYNSHCLGFHVEAYQFFASRDDNTNLTEDLVAIRDVLWRKLEMVHRNPSLIRQQFFNDIGNATPRRLCSGGIIEASESSIRDYAGVERVMVRWENIPSEALTQVSVRSGCESEGDVRCVRWLDDATFLAGYASGAVEMWDANRGSTVARFVGHERAVTALELINNDLVKNARTSVYVASASRDKTVRIWRLDDSLGRDCTTLTGHEEPVTSLAVALSTNELFSVGGDEIRCWSCAPGYPLLYVLNTEHKVPVNSISLAPDLSFMITAATDGVMRLWVFTLENSTMVQQKSRGTNFHRADDYDDRTSGVGTSNHTPSVGNSSFIGGRRTKKVASQPPTVTLEFRGHIGEITCTACASTGLFASSGVDSSIMLWEPRNAKHVGLIKAHDGPITALSFNRDGKLLVSASVDRTCKIHSSLTGKLIVSMNHIHRITCASISLDASCVVTGAGDGTMRLWSWIGRRGTASTGAYPRDPNMLRRAEAKEDVESRKSDDTTVSVHRAKVTAAAHLELHGVGSYFVTGASDGSVRVLDSKNWKLNMDMTPLQAKVVKDDLAFTPSPILTMHSERSDSIVYFGRSDGSLTAWDFSANSWAWSKSKVAQAHELGVFSMTDAGHGTLITGGGGGKICVWDVRSRSGPTIMKSFEAHNSRVRGLCSDDSFTLYSTGGDRLVKFWDLDHETCKREFIAHDTIVVDCTLTPRGLATVDIDGLVKIWDERAATESARFQLPPGVPLSCTKIADQQHWIATTTDFALYVSDVRTFREVITFPSPRAQTRVVADVAVGAAAFNPAGTRAVVADAFGCVHGLSTAFVSNAVLDAAQKIHALA